MAEDSRGTPKPTLSVLQAVSIMVGIVVGIGIFRTPSIVASNVGSEYAFVAVWIAGGLITLIGSLCYAELASAFPNAGGEYHFLSRAYGRPVAVLFGWARGSVIQTGAIAAVAFVFGDYAQEVLSLGPYGGTIYAALAIVVFTALNIKGTKESAFVQNALTVLDVAAILLITIAGFVLATTVPASVAAAPAAMSGTPALGLAMILVLLTYGGWNEAAYLSAELKDVQRNMVRVLLIGTAVLTVLYTVVNIALVAGLGLDGVRRSSTIAADVMRSFAGAPGAIVLSLCIVAAALSTLNATIFTGARVYYAMARDIRILPQVGQWDERGATPANGLLMQGVVALALVLFGAMTKDGFKAMVDYTAPVFWGFLLLVAIGLFVLRAKEPDRPRPFKVPLYPLTPALFALTCVYMLYSSLAYTGYGALVGVGVVILGLPLLFAARAGDGDAARTSTPAE